MQKESIVLDPAWQFKEFPESARRLRDLDSGNWLDASVPASIYTCLDKAGVISISDLLSNTQDFDWVDGKDWIFGKEFDIPQSLLEKDCIEIIFNGLDTVAHIWLNDKLIGKTENMFIDHRFDIKPYLKQSKNKLYVKFVSALQHADRLIKRYGKLGDHHLRSPRSSYIRKPAYQFSSTFGPSLTGCGIFRDVRIEASNAATIENLHLRTIDCNQHYADIRIAIALNRINQSSASLQCKITITGGGLNLTQQVKFESKDSSATTVMHIDRPILWWPHGYGVPHLYHVKMELMTADGQLLDTDCQDFGIRTIRIEKSDSKSDFFINEQRVHIKGADWMPPSLFPGATDKADYEHLLNRAKECHISLLRVCAAGYYEDPAFYELCNRMGILVWQDFMFDNAYYPDRQWFLDIVKEEAQTIIKQLRNHACIALWCGNNNIDWLHKKNRLGKGRKFYGKPIFHKLLPDLIHELDPDRHYMPTRSRPNDESQTLVANTPDIPSPPALSSLSEFNDSFRTIESLPHNRDQLSKISQCQLFKFLPPKTLEEHIWQSQVVQARLVQNAVEQFRIDESFGGNCILGALKDYALQISSSMLDSNAQPKALYYYAKRFFAPILIALYPDEENGDLKAHIVNDSPLPLTGVLSCQMMDTVGNILDSTEIPVTVSPFSKIIPKKLPKSLSFPQDRTQAFLYLCLKNNDSIIAKNTFFSCPDKEFNWPGLSLDIQVSAESQKRMWNVMFLSKTIVRDLQITPPQAADLSDNFITLLPNQPKYIQILYKDFAPSTQIPVKLYSVNQSLNPD